MSAFIEFRPPVDRRDERGDLAMLPHFGMRHLSVVEAARIIAVDTWCAGKIEVAEPRDVTDEALNDPALIDALSEHIELFQDRLTKAVLGGWLRAKISRDADGNMLPARTFVERDDLISWLIDTGHDYDELLAEWMETNDEACYRVSELARHYRGVGRNEVTHDGEFESAEPIFSELRQENADLRRQLETLRKSGQERVDRPITQRQRRTLLTIIAALCDYSDIKPNAREAAGQIASMTDEIGASVTAETIRTLLKEIPHALETRKK